MYIAWCPECTRTAMSVSLVYQNIVISFLYIVRCPGCTGTAVSVRLVFQKHRYQFFCTYTGVQCAQGQQSQSVWCINNIVISFLYIVRCPECTGTAVSVSLVFQEHRHQFSVCNPVSRVRSDSSVSQSGVS